MAQGIDPAEEKRRRHYVASELTFNAVADRFEEKGLEGLREKTREFFKSTLRIYLRPKLGKRPLPAIQGSEIFSVLDDLSTHSPALRRNVFAVARRMMRWAKGRGIIDRNPLEGFEVPAAAPSRDRVLNDHELKLVWTASEELGAIFCGLVRLLLLTGQRRDEVAGLEWQELDRARAEWILPSAPGKEWQRAPYFPVSTSHRRTGRPGRKRILATKRLCLDDRWRKIARIRLLAVQTQIGRAGT
ncbi:tyrosine-type recombinase/integrase [Sphingopyxis sp. JAI128]|uniref:tyrosine-type recombinase/integrase n=1 Tax=Sphingopyxis sp. JAI128 TaxID=2723066 RepID=UPI00390C5657